MDIYTNACWNAFYKSIVNVVVEPDDAETLDYLKEKYLNSINKNQAKYPSSSPGYAKVTKTGTTRAPNSYNLYYKKWKEENGADEFDDPDHEGQTLKPRTYFNTHVWGKMSQSKKDNIKKEFQSETGKQSKERKDYSAFGFFKDKHRPMLEECLTEKEIEDLKHPDPKKNAPITLYRLIQYIWTEYVSKDKDLSKDFNDLSKKCKDQIKKNKPAEYDLDKLPHLDVEKLKNYEFEDLEMFYDE